MHCQGNPDANANIRKDEVARHLNEIVPPVLACFTDQDARVRYYACEAMYNISKVAKGEVLVYFNLIFDALCKVGVRQHSILMLTRLSCPRTLNYLSKMEQNFSIGSSKISFLSQQHITFQFLISTRGHMRKTMMAERHITRVLI